MNMISEKHIHDDSNTIFKAIVNCHINFKNEYQMITLILNDIENLNSAVNLLITLSK